jgi:catechol 2,3-dioxygenase-like lactoylglutathione lyase family enzyme
LNLLRLDHLVLTVRDVAVTVEFYVQVLGMESVTFGGDRMALRFGREKINLHQAGHEIEPKAKNVQRGSADLCFLTETPLSEVIRHLEKCGVSVELGPVPRTGAESPIESVYIRDPDGNLIELSNAVTPAAVVVTSDRKSN